MENTENVRKRGYNRTTEAIVADLDDRIRKHEQLYHEAEDKANKTIAYHKACIETLTIKREAALNPKKNTSPAAALLKKIKEKGLTMDEAMQLIDKM